MKKQKIQTWEEFSEANIFSSYKVYHPKNFSRDILGQVIEYIQITLNKRIVKDIFFYDHLILNRVLLYVTSDMPMLDLYCTDSVLTYKYEIDFRLREYLNLCEYTYLGLET